MQLPSTVSGTAGFAGASAQERRGGATSLRPHGKPEEDEASNSWSSGIFRERRGTT